MLHFDSADIIKDSRRKVINICQTFHSLKDICDHVKHSCKKIPHISTFQYNKYHINHIHSFFLYCPTSSILHYIREYSHRTPEIYNICEVQVIILYHSFLDVNSVKLVQYWMFSTWIFIRFRWSCNIGILFRPRIYDLL